MPEVDELERSLALAQIGLAAPPGVRERVRAKLGSVAMPPELTTPAAAGSRTPLTRGALSRASGVARRGVPTWGALALTGLGFAAGYLLGHRPAPLPDEAARQTSAVRTEAAQAGTALRAAAVAQPEAAARADGTPERSLPPVAEAPAQGTKKGSGASAVRDQVEGEPNGSGALEAHVRTRAPRRVAEPNGLARELALLQRAERAIRARNADLAVALLDQLDREHPKAQLVQEREAARLLADCEQSAQGVRASAAPNAASERARQYLAGHPASVYSERIRNLCALDASAVRAMANPAGVLETTPLAPDRAEGPAQHGH